MKKLLLLFISLFLLVNAIFAQIEKRSFEFDGLTRDYNVFLPQNYQPNMPVVINLHPANMFQRFMGYSMMNDVADTAGFIVVYPSAIGGRWNWDGEIFLADDVGFISALIDTLENLYNIDMSRIYCAGGSSGGFMTFRLLVEIGHRFAAAASVAGTLFDDALNRKPTQFSPILIIHGTADPIVLYGGSTSYLSVEETINYWIQNNNCSLQADTLLLPDIDTTDNCTIEKISWTNCSNNSSIIHYKVIDGGHHWPGGNINFMNNRSGNLNNDVNSSAEMWNFFKNYTNPLVNIEDELSNLPKEFVLEQNYPNPFNPSTTIKYQIPLDVKRETKNVKLVVYDILGRVVAVLVNQKQKPGNFEVEFDGSELTSGVYFYKLSAGEFTDTKKVILMK